MLCLSRHFSIDGVLVPEQCPGGLTRHQFSIFDEDIPMNDSELARQQSAALLAFPEGVADAPNATTQFAIMRDDD